MLQHARVLVKITHVITSCFAKKLSLAYSIAAYVCSYVLPKALQIYVK